MAEKKPTVEKLSPQVTRIKGANIDFLIHDQNGFITIMTKRERAPLMQLTTVDAIAFADGLRVATGIGGNE